MSKYDYFFSSTTLLALMAENRSYMTKYKIMTQRGYTALSLSCGLKITNSTF
jgi:hypothetical protein